jgi:hypothetical protein
MVHSGRCTILGEYSMRNSFVTGAIITLCFAAVLPAESQSQGPVLAQATVEGSQPQLPPSNYELAAEDTIFVWRDLDSGKVTKEYVKEHVGRLMQSNFGSRRSFAYVPDPWADDENTEEADIEPLFPLEVGKKVEFYRQPRAGRTHDMVEVVRTETLNLPFGPVDTYVIETTSKVVSGSWVGKARVWYAPSLRWQVQWVITDNAGDNRRRQVIEVQQP